MLKRIINPIMAPIASQYPHGPLKEPLSFRIAFPIVGASMFASVFGCSSIQY